LQPSALICALRALRARARRAARRRCSAHAMDDDAGASGAAGAAQRPPQAAAAAAARFPAVTAALLHAKVTITQKNKAGGLERGASAAPTPGRHVPVQHWSWQEKHGMGWEARHDIVLFNEPTRGELLAGQFARPLKRLRLAGTAGRARPGQAQPQGGSRSGSPDGGGGGGDEYPRAVRRAAPRKKHLDTLAARTVWYAEKREPYAAELLLRAPHIAALRAAELLAIKGLMQAALDDAACAGHACAKYGAVAPQTPSAPPPQREGALSLQHQLSSSRAPELLCAVLRRRGC
jgi:hypothetical protein